MSCLNQLPLKQNKTDPSKKIHKAVKDRGGGGLWVGMTAVKDSMVFFKDFPSV